MQNNLWKKIILKCGLSVMYLLAFLLVPTHFLHKEAVCWLTEMASVVPQVLYTSWRQLLAPWLVSEMLRRRIKCCSVASTWHVFRERDDGVHRAIKVEMSFQGNVCSPKKRQWYNQNSIIQRRFLYNGFFIIVLVQGSHIRLYRARGLVTTNPSPSRGWRAMDGKWHLWWLRQVVTLTRSGIT